MLFPGRARSPRGRTSLGKWLPSAVFFRSPVISFAWTRSNAPWWQDGSPLYFDARRWFMKPEPALSIRILHVLDNMGRGGMQNGLVNLIEHLDHERFEHIICSTRYLAEEKAHQFP